MLVLRHVLPLLFVIALAAHACGEEPREIIFCSYNLENFTEGRGPGETTRTGTKAKSEDAIATQVRIISEIRPDILGVCEMGSPGMLEQFRTRLREAGCDFPHVEYVASRDEDRHLALLSRFPIVARASQDDVRFELKGREEWMRRGILDVTIEVSPAYRLRCVGAHLKSKLAAPQGEAIIRRLEARKLREHLDRIFASDASTNVLCYGDFNDSKNQPMFQEVSGTRGTPGFLTDLPCADRHGDRWTHYWKVADEYSRIDYLFASRALLPEVNTERAGIYRSDDWSAASDHRPIFVPIRPVDSKSH